MAALRIEKLSRYFIYAAIFNLIAAIVITAPVIVPEFTFPLVLTIWPGTWMFISYFVFLIVAVLGTLGWAVLLDLVSRHFKKGYVNRYMAQAHFSLTMLGVYGQSSLMFALGYIGGTAKLLGFANTVITQGLIGWMVVPIGVFIYIYLVGTVIGVANILLTISGRSPDH